MTILQDVLATLPDDREVRSVLIGARCTAVCSRYCGLASTVTGSLPYGDEPVRDVGRLHRKSARELAEYALSDNPLEASVGVAAINSLLDEDETGATETNAFDILAGQGRGKTVALVGHFPTVPGLRKQVGRLSVIELYPSEGDYPAAAAAELIPEADVVAITGSTLINHTLDGLLAMCRRDAFVMVLGPTTPLSPVMFSHGVTILCGAHVIDEAAALLTVGQGASFRQVAGVRLWSIAAPGKDGWKSLATRPVP